MKFYSTISVWSRTFWLGQLFVAMAFPSITVAAEPIETRDVYVHTFSHFSFPTNVGQFFRVNLNKYDEEGRDISAGYNLLVPPLTVTLYVYPAPKNVAVLPQKPIAGVTEAIVDRHFGQVRSDVKRSREGVEILSESAYELPQDKNKRKGRRAVFAYQERFAGLNQNVRSELYLFLLEPGKMFLIDDRFFVKYRITYPASEKELAEKEVQTFLKSLTWPTK